jgi:hypothetical protein
MFVWMMRALVQSHWAITAIAGFVALVKKDKVTVTLIQNVLRA